jgi:hypothetical protein
MKITSDRPKTTKIWAKLVFRVSDYGHCVGTELAYQDQDSITSQFRLTLTLPELLNDSGGNKKKREKAPSSGGAASETASPTACQPPPRGTSGEVS